MSPSRTLRVPVAGDAQGREFEGPLDVLLHLIERRELDITTISLALVADQYLALLREADNVDPDALAEFIAVGAKLLLIKSIALLPRREQERQLQSDDLEDPTDLTERLRLYEAFRRSAGALRARQEAPLRSFPRVAPPPPPRATLAPGAYAPRDLQAAMRRVVARALRTMPREELPRAAVSVPEMMALLRERLGGGERLSFFALLAGRPRATIVATFLAILELLRLGEIAATQGERFADVTIEAARPGPHP